MNEQEKPRSPSEKLENIERIVDDIIDKINQIKDNLERCIKMLELIEGDLPKMSWEAEKKCVELARPHIIEYYQSLKIFKRRNKKSSNLLQ